MKRYGYIIEEIISEANMGESFDYVMRGVKRKSSCSGRWMVEHREEIISDLQRRISDGSYRVSGYHSFTIMERGKEREIQSIPLKDRVALNAIMRIVEKYLNRRFIADSAASIKGKGMHYLHARMKRDMKRHPQETLFVFKCDIRKFYHSIDQEVVKALLRRVFKDDRLLCILDGCVSLLPKGLSIGLRSSQALGNLLLDHYIDHKLKDDMGVGYYRRYCDDMVVQARDYGELTRIRRVIHDQLKEVGLTVKANEQLFCVLDRPIDFLGYQTYGNGRVGIRKHIKQRFACRWRRTKSKKRRVSLIGSFYGLAKHADACHLFKQLTKIRMKDFADFGLRFVAKDGKKRFECPSVSLGDLQNRTIIVEDYEKGIKTKEGDGRYVVKFRSDEIGEGKFFTNSEELKQMLDKISEVEGFPFRTSIKRQVFGSGKVKYSFT